MLDTIARAPLWEHGLDYGHGTGHGVGYFLNVHEGPQSFSRVIPEPAMAMQPGMITSIEPGLYRPGQWGVRVENLVLNGAGGRASASEFGEFLEFETLTLCPIDTRCLEPSLLRADEIAWLNAYHVTVRERLAPLVERRCAGLADAAHRAARLVPSPLGAAGTASARLRPAFVAVRRSSSAPGPDSSQAGFAADAAVPRVRSIASPRPSLKEPAMISRLTFCAALFAAVTTVSLAYAADSAQQAQAAETARAAAPRRRRRRHADGRSDRQAASADRLRDRRGVGRADQRLPGRTRPVSCGPFLLPTAPAAAKSAPKGAQGIAARYRNEKGWRSHGGNSSPTLPRARPPSNLHGKPPAAALHRRLRDQRGPAVARSSGVFAVARARALRSSRRLGLAPCCSPAAACGGRATSSSRASVGGGLGGIPLVAAALALALAGLAGGHRRGRDPQDAARVRRPGAR